MNKILFPLLSCIIAQNSVNGMDPSYPLHIAAASGNIERVKALLDNGTDVNQRDAKGNTPLHWAVITKHIPSQIEKELWERARAADSGDSDRVRTLLDNGANVYYAVFPHIPSQVEKELLGRAYREHRLAIAQLLIKRGANVNLQNSLGITPLMNATEEDFLHLLLDNGADVNLMDVSGFTALGKAAAKRDLDTALPILLNHGAKITSKPSARILMNIVSLFFTPLELPKPEIAHLLKLWPKIVSQNKARWLSLCMAMHPRIGAHSPARGLHSDVFQKICNYARPQAVPMSYAIQTGNVEAITELLDAGANANREREYDNDPLFSAVFRGRQAVVQLLLNHGANINALELTLGVENETPFVLTMAINEEYRALADLLRSWPTVSGCKSAILAFCMAMHPRVGAKSPARIVDQHVFQEIGQYVILEIRNYLSSKEPIADPAEVAKYRLIFEQRQRQTQSWCTIS